MTCNGLLVEVLSLSCKRAAKFSGTLFVLSFGFFRCLTDALSYGFMSSFIFFSFNKILKKTIWKKDLKQQQNQRPGKDRWFSFYTLPLPLFESDCRHPATVALFAGFLSSLLSARRRVVPRISSCRVNTTSRRVINQLGISFGPIFLLFLAGGNPRPPPLNDSPGPGCWKFLSIVPLVIKWQMLIHILPEAVTPSNGAEAAETWREKKYIYFFRSKFFLFLLKLVGFLFRLLHRWRAVDFLLEGVFLCKRAVKFSVNV